MPPVEPLFDRLRWTDPVTGESLIAIVGARTPSGNPIWGVLKRSDSQTGYPIVDGVARVTPELATRYAEWLTPFQLSPPEVPAGQPTLQPETTVESFGFQWTWNSEMRSEADLRWRIAERFDIGEEYFRDVLVLDAGSGAGDQSRWLNYHGAEVVSIDLSSAIDVVARKLRSSKSWVGIQGDLTRLPLAASQFDRVYCEGVIQHTRDSALAVRELSRVLRVGGEILATHYESPEGLPGRVRLAYLTRLRQWLRRLSPEQLLLLTGTVSAIAHVPLLGPLVVRSGLAIRYDLMPGFKTTWTNTFDYFGSHSHQRHITPEAFWACFEAAGHFRAVVKRGTVVRAQRVA